MLTDDEMARIRAEEEAAAMALLARQQAPRHARARRRYRAQVRGQLRPFNPFWLLLGALMAASLVGLLAWPRSSVPDDTSGGIADSLLTLRCKQELRVRLGDLTLRFPSSAEVASQMSASSEGKRWDGWTESPDGRHADFSCEYTPATDQLSLELIPSNVSGDLP